MDPFNADLSRVLYSADRDALINSVRVNPQEKTPKAVLADWLDEFEPHRGGEAWLLRHTSLPSELTPEGKAQIPPPPAGQEWEHQGVNLPYFRNTVRQLVTDAHSDPDAVQHAAGNLQDFLRRSGQDGLAEVVDGLKKDRRLWSERSPLLEYTTPETAINDLSVLARHIRSINPPERNADFWLRVINSLPYLGHRTVSPGQKERWNRINNHLKTNRSKMNTDEFHQALLNIALVHRDRLEGK